ncbi:hypothetical protein MBANPS3_009857 [Mucor bainieri]
MAMQMNMNVNAGGRNVMPETHILNNENNLPGHFVAAKRISMRNFMNKPNELRNTIQEHCIKKGKPLVISDMQTQPTWNHDIFSLDQLKAYRGDDNVAFNFPDGKKEVVLGKFIEKLQQQNRLARDRSYTMLKGSTRKVYAKDISCPDQYAATLEKIVPNYLLPRGPDDLFSIMPDHVQAENFMCYIGQDSTGTPIHRDLCGTMGHNLMTMGDTDSFAEWIIIENQHRDKLASILRPSQADNLVADLSGPPKHSKSSFMESDRAWLHNPMLENAQFQAQVIVQRPGDLVIVPSRAYHQVRNVGVSVKIAWNRITARTLQYAFEDQLPLYQTINRPEVYKCKAIVALTLKQWNKELKELNIKDITAFSQTHGLHIPSTRNTFFDNSTILLGLFLSEVIAPEMLYQNHKIVTDKKGEEFTVRCDFCYSDIFHRYYHCDTCESYDLCLNCYSMGRSCEHVTEMKMHQSPKRLHSYIKLYQDYVKNLNAFMISKSNYICEQHKEEYFMNLKPSDASNLASTCLRLERFRQKYKDQHNTLACQHCNTATTVNELGSQGISLASVFKNSPCSRVATKRKQHVDVYTCEPCSKKCKECQPMKVSKESIQDFDLVYYTQPTHNVHSRGCYKDFNVAKNCDNVPPRQKRKRDDDEPPRPKRRR